MQTNSNLKKSCYNPQSYSNY